MVVQFNNINLSSKQKRMQSQDNLFFNEKQGKKQAAAPTRDIPISQNSNEESYSDHLCTILSLQLDYFHQKNPYNQDNQAQKGKNMPNIKALIIQYQSGFLRGKSVQIQLHEVPKLIVNHQKLKQIFQSPENEDQQALKRFIEFLLLVKQESLRKQFISLYQIIARIVTKTTFEQVKTEDKGQNWKQMAKKILLDHIVQSPEQFKFFTSQLTTARKQAEQLLVQQAYCMLAEYHCFNLNWYYDIAFQKTMQKPKKKIKQNTQ